MLAALRRMLRGDAPDPFGREAPIDRPTWAVGDVHGRADLLARMIERADPEARLVLMGDYFDRGEHSREVLTQLLALREAEREVVFLFGNHELMMLDFLDAPARNGPLWLRNGGLQTLLSFGVGQGVAERGEAALPEAAEELSISLGEGEAFLRSLPVRHRAGDVFFAHAGADPGRPLDDQDLTDLVWGSPAFLTTPREDGVWVVHGHYIQDEPSVAQGRVAVDTGAYFSGRLTAARLAPGEDVSFVSA